MPQRQLQRRLAATFLVAGLAGAAACSSGGSSSGLTSPTSPTSPTIAITTENFTGTVAVGGSDVHPFTVTLTNGDLNATLTAAGPPAGIFMGLGIGTLSGTACTLLSGGAVVTAASATPQLSGTAAAGSYCVVVSDVGNQTSDITYAVTVMHY